MHEEYYYVDLREGDFIIDTVNVVTGRKTPCVKYPDSGGTAPADLVDAIAGAEMEGCEVRYSDSALARLGGPV